MNTVEIPRAFLELPEHLGMATAADPSFFRVERLEDGYSVEVCVTDHSTPEKLSLIARALEALLIELLRLEAPRLGADGFAARFHELVALLGMEPSLAEVVSLPDRDRQERRPPLRRASSCGGAP
jgi:hypothetical protein